MTGIVINNNEYTVSTGSTKIEYNSMGEDTVSYSMYGGDIPVKKNREFVFKCRGSGGSNAYILTNKKLYGIGNNFAKQFGPNSGAVKVYTLIAEDVKDFAFSGNRLFYIDTGNNLYGIGSNYNGALGLGSVASVDIFTKLASNVSKVHADERDASWYITLDGDLYGCGNNDYGQQSSGDTNNILVFTKRLSNIRDVTTAGYITAAITNDNILYLCGNGTLGKQGDGNASSHNVYYFTQRATDVKDVCPGSDTVFYIKNPGDLYASGWFNSTNYIYFEKIDNSIKCDSQFNQHYGYLSTTNVLYLGGRNNYGQCSTGRTSTTTTAAARLFNVSDFILNYATSWAITISGDLYGCGDGFYGQQGDGNDSSHNVLTLTKRAENVKAVYGTESSTFYVDNDNNLYGCGQPCLIPNATAAVTEFTKIDISNLTE